MCLSLLTYKRWSRGGWIDHLFPIIELALMVIVAFIGIATQHHEISWINAVLFVDLISWVSQRDRWIKRRMQLKGQLPESARLESVALPRCDLILASAGEDNRRTAKVLQRMYVIAPREATELCEQTPSLLKSKVWDAEAEFVKEKLEAAGATIELRQTDDVCAGDKD